MVLGPPRSATFDLEQQIKAKSVVFREVCRLVAETAPFAVFGGNSRFWAEFPTFWAKIALFLFWISKTPPRTLRL